MSNRVRKFFQRTLPVVAALMVLFAALYLAGDATRGLGAFSKYYPWVFVLAGVALLVLTVAIGNRVWRLVTQLRSASPGARLTLRMVILFVVLAVPPASVVYWFSVDFLNRSIDSWFDVDVEAAFNDALEIGQRFLEVQKIEKQSLTGRLAARLADEPEERLSRQLRGMLLESDAIEIAVLSRGGQVIRWTSRGADFSPDLPEDFELIRASRGGSYVDHEALGEGLIQIRALESIPDRGIGPERILQVIYPVAQGFDEQADKVEREYEQYQNLAFQRNLMKRSFVLILSLVLLFSVLVAVLLAFTTARKLVHPIGRLADATNAIAGGDYQRQLPVPGSNDELSFLVSSFNTMTRELSRSSDEATRSRRQAEERRDYLEAVLGRLSSGVMTFDGQGQLRTANPAATQILGLALTEFLEQPLSVAVEREPGLEPLAELVDRHFGDSRDWREELLLERTGQQQVLMCRGAQLPTAGEGVVLVFDDMTDLVRAQREAAWGEVARRLAHEVKNPLTPIQLSAERLRHKYLKQMPEADAEVLDRATRTIVAQVEALKTMVNAFSEYSRAPALQLEALRVSDLVNEVLELYRSGEKKLQVETRWMASEPLVFVDPGRIRQLLHNLVKNAQEASESRDLELEFATEVIWSDGHAWLSLSMRDNGPGLPFEIIDKLFEPYATTKSGGTGIGLAIVKQIAEEHGGQIQARNDETGGAVFELHLPVDAGELNSEPSELSAGGVG